MLTVALSCDSSTARGTRHRLRYSLVPCPAPFARLWVNGMGAAGRRDRFALPSYATEGLDTRSRPCHYKAPHSCHISFPFLQQAKSLYAYPNISSPRLSSRVLPASTLHPAATERNTP